MFFWRQKRKVAVDTKVPHYRSTVTIIYRPCSKHLQLEDLYFDYAVFHDSLEGYTLSVVLLEWFEIGF